MSALTDELDKATPEQRGTLKAMTALRLGLIEELARDLATLRAAVGNLAAPQTSNNDAWTVIEAKGYRRGVEAAFTAFGGLLEMSTEISRELLAELKK